MANSRWQDICNALQGAGFDVYSPGTKVGDCTSNYVVVKNDGSTGHPVFSTDIDFYSVMCYVPKLKYSELEPMVQSVKQTMKTLKPMILQHSYQTPSFYDDSCKAHMVSIEYKNYKKV